MSAEPSISVVVPDTPVPLVGYREWFLRDGGSDRTELSSLFHPTAWPHDRPMAAVCLRPRSWPYPMGPPHGEVPDHGCECGIYAFLNPEFDTLHGAHGQPRARGAIVGWGRFVLGTEGWRTEFARIVALLEHPEHPDVLHRVAERYGVPVLETLSGLRLRTLPWAA